jgi:tRNA(fMet)-specific endonuclease VapC
MPGSKLALDTNAYSDWQRGIRWDRSVKLARLVWLPFVVVAELRSGFEAGTQAKKNALILDAFLTSDAARILYPDETTLILYAKIFTQLRNQGTPIPTNDLWIASLCAQHNLPLATTDNHFQNIHQLILVEDTA